MTVKRMIQFGFSADCRPSISAVCTNYSSDIVTFLYGWNGTWWCPRSGILRVEASISIITRGLQWCLTIIVRKSRDIPNIIAQGLWSYNLMILERPKSRFDYTLFDLTVELTPPHNIFHRATFRVYSSNDLVDMELGGTLKNVIAIGAGVCDGIGFGDNSKAALVTRVIVEMRKLGVACGAQAPIMPPLCRRFNFLSLGKPASNCLNSSDLDYSEKYIQLRRCSSQGIIIIFHLWR